MRKAIALVSILSVLAEVPSCNGKDDIGEGGVAVSPSPPINSPYRKETRDQHTVRFWGDWKPDKPGTVTWHLNGKPQKVFRDKGPFSHIEHNVPSGSTALLIIHARPPGYMTCKIYIDGRMLQPNENDHWNPYENGYNRTNCTASIVVP